MKAADIRETYTTVSELEEHEADLRRKLWKARFDNHTNQLDQTSEIGKLRKDVARVKTILSEMRAQAAAASTES